MTSFKETVDYKKIEEGVRNSTRRVWLAGLGVLSTVEEEGAQLFDELVERGKKIEARGKKRWNKTRKEFESTTDELGGKIDQRVSDVLQRMGVPSRSQVEDLTSRVEKLSGQVERLAVSGKKAPARPKARKTTSRKTKAA